jgi:short-subunit dehydrogenase
MTQVTQPGLAVITGATGAIGQLYARGLAERGYRLLLIARDQAALEQLAESVTTTTGQSAETSVTDLADRNALDALASRLMADPDVSLLANIAGPATFCSFEDIAVAKIDQMISVNIAALTVLCRSVATGFVERGRGSIVNFASVLAFRPWGEFNVYNASKAFLIALSQCLQADLREKGILVQVVTPAICATGFWEKAGFPFALHPPSMVMETEDLVNAALRGLDLNEEWVFPSLSDPVRWAEYDYARVRLMRDMMHGTLANRYVRAVP